MTDDALTTNDDILALCIPRRRCRSPSALTQDPIFTYLRSKTPEELVALQHIARHQLSRYEEALRLAMTACSAHAGSKRRNRATGRCQFQAEIASAIFQEVWIGPSPGTIDISRCLHLSSCIGRTWFPWKWWSADGRRLRLPSWIIPAASARCLSTNDRGKAIPTLSRAQ